MSKQHDETSKFLSYVLRHEPHAIGITLDSEGWADIDALITCALTAGRTLDHELIRAVVASSDKKRFAISEDGLRIRAVQGHSTDTVAIQHEAKQPPEFLYHGTATRFLDSILAEGLRPGQRHHVHLSQDIATATTVGQRETQLWVKLVFVGSRVCSPSLTSLFATRSPVGQAAFNISRSIKSCAANDIKVELQAELIRDIHMRRTVDCCHLEHPSIPAPRHNLKLDWKCYGNCRHDAMRRVHG